MINRPLDASGLVDGSGYKPQVTEAKWTALDQTMNINGWTTVAKRFQALWNFIFNINSAVSAPPFSLHVPIGICKTETESI